MANAPAEPRRPVHVVYGGAQLFKAGTARKLGELALAALERHAPDDASFAAAFALEPGLAARVRARVAQKLRAEPVEDFRVDFEDGYGHRPDAEEDAHAASAAAELAQGLKAGSLPPFTGVRVKALSGAAAPRARRTLELFVSALLRGSGGRLPSGFVVTLPKVERASEPAELAKRLAALERRHRLPSRSIKAELMVETPAALVGPGGACPLPKLVDALDGRCAGAHLGAYDYLSACCVAAPAQHLGHPGCVFARQLMQAALAGGGVALSDGATTLLPTGEDGELVRRAWRRHYEDARRSLSEGFYQGWDLHPAQLVSRYAAVYSFFLEALPDSAARLRRFLDGAARAVQAGGVFDDAATGQGLLNFFLRGTACGALTDEEAASSGLSPEELAGRSFLRILESRRS